MTPDEPPAWLPADGPTLVTRVVRPALVLLSLGVLAAAVAIAFLSLLNIVEVWFEYQYVPIARAVLGLAVAAIALQVLRLLLRKPRVAP